MSASAIRERALQRRLRAHLRASAARLDARLPSRPDPEREPAAFSAWLQTHAVPVGEAIKNPDFIELQQLLSQSTRLRYWRASREGRAWRWVAYLLACEQWRGVELDTGRITKGMRYKVRTATLGGAPGASNARTSPALAYFAATIRRARDPELRRGLSEAKLFWAIRRWRERKRLR